jgi:NAD(P)-dependent dehydrogenase (short-subunit alcohol dehydrogenase family)
MQGKICLVTGGSAGIGEVTARELARQGAQVVIVSRNAERCAAAVERIQKATGSLGLSYIAADLSTQAEVRRAAQVFTEQYDRLDVLVNNAGAWFMRRRLSADGIEMSFALNHLSYFLLTHLLLPALQASPAGRMVIVSSDAHFGSQLNFDDLQTRRFYEGFRAYSRSKLANVLFCYELARRLQAGGSQSAKITANVLHPGFVASQFGKNNGRVMAWVMDIAHRFGISPEEGAQTSLYLACSPEVAGVSGKYFTKMKATPSSPASYDLIAARRLWEISLQMCGLTEIIL